MDNSGLGTLARLPREIRDMIFDLSLAENDCPCTGRLILDSVFSIHDSTCTRRVTALPSVKGLKRMFGERLSPTLRTKCSRQFYREYLESYLRNISILFAGRTWDMAAITQALQSLNTVADVASHTRKLSIGCHLRIVYNDCPNTCLSRQKFLIKFPEALKTSKCCNHLFGIPASRLSIAVFHHNIALSIAKYLPMKAYAYRWWDLVRVQTDLRECLRLPIEIVAGDRVQSVQNMEISCGVIEKLIYASFALFYEDSRVLSNHGPYDNIEEDIKKIRLMVKHTLCHVRELHLVFIEVAMQYWETEDEEELENFCRRLRWRGKFVDND